MISGDDVRICALVPNDAGWQRVSLARPVVLGSGPEADVRLRRLARRHCRLEDHNGQVVAQDLTGGALTVAGRSVGRQVRLSAGAVLRLAGVPIVLLQERGATPWLSCGALGSACPKMWRAMAELALAGESGAPLLVTGESGSGKELASRVAHDASPRANAAFVALNCAALPAGLLEAELFGARRGAYTGSVDHRDGAFVRADGGTLLLDEVGELSAAAQAALLRVLETGEVQVVGGDVRRVDVRVIAATHRDLRAAVADGGFRLDLLHRLAVAEVQLPPLRARAVDLLPLLERFLGAPLPRDAAAALRDHGWPGNVRELRNVARRLAMRCGGASPTVAEVRRAIGIPPAPAPSPHRRALVAGLLETCPTVGAAHRASGLPRSTFFRYVKELRSPMTPDAPAAAPVGVLMT